MRSRWLLVVLLVVLLAPASAGCARANQVEGAGETTNLCRGWAELETLREPSVDDTAGALAHGRAFRRTIERIDLEARVDGEPVPAAIVDAVEQIDAHMEQFVETAEDADARAAQAELVDTDFDDLHATIGAEVTRSC